MNLQQAVALLFISTFLYVTVLIFQPGILSALPNILSWSYSEYIDDPYSNSARRNLALNISENTGTPLLNFKDLGDNKAKVLLLVIVSTAPQRFARRQAIRDTWWKHCAGNQVKCVFVTDGLTEDENQRTLILKERIRYKDLEFQPLLGGREFGLRFLNHIKWAKAKFDFRFLLRTDDDYFLCLKSLLSELPVRPDTSLVWGNFHCQGGITWVDESFMIFSPDIIYKFLAQNETTMMCHPHADQQIGLWLESIDNKLFFHDSRLYHHPPASFSKKFENVFNVCDSYLGIHGTYVEKMRYFGRNANDGAKTVVPMADFADFCPTTHFDYRKIRPPFFFKPKPCITNPTWNLERNMYGGREEEQEASFPVVLVISPVKLVGKIHHVRFQPSSAHSDNWPGDEASPFLEGPDSFPRPNQVPVVQTLNHSAIHRIKVYPVDNAINFPCTCPLDSYLSDG